MEQKWKCSCFVSKGIYFLLAATLLWMALVFLTCSFLLILLEHFADHLFPSPNVLSLTYCSVCYYHATHANYMWKLHIQFLIHLLYTEQSEKIKLYFINSHTAFESFIQSLEFHLCCALPEK